VVGCESIRATDHSSTGRPDSSSETPSEQTETATTEEADDPNWLPDEQQKVFPDDVIAKYGKRYGYTQEQIQANPSLRQLSTTRSIPTSSSLTSGPRLKPAMARYRSEPRTRPPR